MKNLPKIRITGSENDYHVFLDDIEISRWLNRVEFDLQATGDGVPVVTLTIVAVPEIPENLMALVSAEMQEIE